MNFTLFHDSFGKLHFQNADKTATVVDPIRSFPLSDPNRLIALVNGHGHQEFLVEDLALLAPENRSVLEADLARREFLPKIVRILKSSAPGTPCHWDVETDRGRTTFTIESDDDIRKLPDMRLLIADSNGIRYRIESVEQLDAASQRIVKRFL